MPTDTSRLHVVCLVDRLGRGGTPAHLRVLLPALARAGARVDLVCLADDQGLGREFTSQGVPVRSLHVRSLLSVHGLRALRALRRTCMAGAADATGTRTVLVAYLYSSGLAGALVRAITPQVRFVLAWRDTGHWLDGRRRRLLCWASRRADLLTANSAAVEAAARELAGEDGPPIRRIYNGVPFPEAPSRGAEPDMVGILARFVPEKGHDLLVRAAARVRERGRPVRLVFGGEGPERAAIERLARAEGLAGETTFLGRVDDVDAFYARIGLYAAPSRAEGFSNAVLEAMARGLPVVAASVGGLPEAVREGETGRLVAPEDPDALADAIETLVANPELARRMGAAGRRRAAQSFSVERMAEGTLAALAEAAGLDEPAPRAHVGYVASQFPRYDETFLAREMLAVRRAGTEVTIFSVKPCRDAVVHPEARTLAERVVHWPLVGSLRVWAGFARAALRHPVRCTRALAELMRHSTPSGGLLVRGLAAFPQACAYAGEAARRACTHLHGTWATHPAAMALVMHRLTGLPWSFTGHAHDIYVDTTGLAYKLRRARFALTCTAANKDYLLGLAPGLDPRRVQVSYHGLDLREAYTPSAPPPGPPFRIVTVGSLFACKGHDRLLRALRLLLDRGVAARLRIVGGGPLEGQIKDLARELDLTASVTLCGYVSQDRMPDQYRGAHAFALAAVPEIHWGIPNVVVEAMACARPVVVTALPALREVIPNDEAGMLVPAAEPEAFARALARLAAEPELCVRMGRAARARVEPLFDLTRNARQVAGLFRTHGPEGPV